MTLRTYRAVSIILFILTVAATIIASSQVKTETLDDLINGFVKQQQFNGSVLVAHNGKAVLQKGYGYANFELRSPNEADTKFRLASVTKQFTAMAVLQLAERGVLKLEGTISDYLPDYPKETGSKVTIHHLLTHTSGIPSYTDFPGFMRQHVRDPYRPQDFIKFFKDSSLLFQPGERFAYNNSAYFLLGVIIEKVTGKPYAQVLADQIFIPLGMKNTGYDVNARLLPKRAAGYQLNGDQLMNAPYIDMTIPYAAGSLYSTVEDLFFWDKALYTESLVKKETMNKIFTPYINAAGPGVPNYYGYGWFLGKEQIGSSTDSVETIEHGGGIFGFNTLMFRVPKTKTTIILLSNVTGGRLRDVTRSILGIVYGKPYDKAKQSAAVTLKNDIQKIGLEKAVSAYRVNKEKKSEYYLNEGELNGAGYEFLAQKKFKEAIALFTLMVESFPRSSNAYDSLGEGYMESGDKENAIKNYEKSVELNPNNDNGKEMLKKLKK
ncbi:MAG: serine hydrolase [Bacteroidota bacterium]